jgi:hypothetical protein
MTPSGRLAPLPCSCPLEVLAVRLSVQRQNAPGEVSTGEIPSEYAAKDEDVVGLRNEEEPYSGLIVRPPRPFPTARKRDSMADLPPPFPRLSLSRSHSRSAF